MKNHPNSKIFRPLRRPRLWQKHVQVPGRAERYEVKTEDGLVLALRRVRAFGRVDDAVIDAPRPAVMLLHGLASNHRGFHFRGRSLAEWLARRGFDVWLPELRGHGDSQFHGIGWRFEDYLRYDIPAILATIGQHSASEKIHWVGHSMGGILLMTYGILNPTAPIGRAITMGSALRFEAGKSGFSHLLKVRGVLQSLGIIPYRAMTGALAPVVGRALRFGAPFQVWPSNVEGAVHRQIYANCFEDIPSSLLASLASVLEPDGLTLDDKFCVFENAPNFPFPLRMLAASRDAQVCVEDIQKSAERLGPAAHCLVIGPDSTGAARTREHYGHWGFMLGRHAEHETWPLIADWLENK